MRLATRLHLVLRLRLSGVVPLLPLHAFTVWTEKSYPFTFIGDKAAETWRWPLHLVKKLRINGFKPPFFFMPSWCAQRKLLTFFEANFRTTCKAPRLNIFRDIKWHETIMNLTENKLLLDSSQQTCTQREVICSLHGFTCNEICNKHFLSQWVGRSLDSQRQILRAVYW